MQTIPTIVNVHTGGFSQFGWDSLVAIATGVLAAITACLAWSTWTLSRETAEDIRSEIRPVLIDAGKGSLTATYGVSADHGVGVFAVKNVGPGPAINAHIKASVAAFGESSWRRLGTVGPGQPGSGTISDFPGIDVEGTGDRTVESEVECVYEDLAGGLHRTTFAYRREHAAKHLDADSDQTRTLWVSLVATQVKTIKGPPRQTRKQRREASEEADRYRRAIA